jgi:hypothetical protein
VIVAGVSPVPGPYDGWVKHPPWLRVGLALGGLQVQVQGIVVVG